MVNVLHDYLKAFFRIMKSSAHKEMLCYYGKGVGNPGEVKKKWIVFKK